MFSSPDFRKYRFDEVPLNRDIYVMGEQWMAEYEKTWLERIAGSDRSPYEMGYVSFVAARALHRSAIELAWFANVYDRFHEVIVSLPKKAFITWVQVLDYDDKPRLFVRDSWVDQLYLRTNSVFAFVDATGWRSREDYTTVV